MANSSVASPPHPYYPVEAQLVGYLANEWSVISLVSTFIGGWAALLGATLALLSFLRPNLKNADKIAVLWFILSTFLSGTIFGLTL